MTRCAQSIFAVALVRLFLASSSQAQDVYSNMVGYHRTDIPSNGVAFITTSFVQGSNSLNDVIGLQADPARDSVLTWDGSSYKKYTLFPPINGDARSNTWVDSGFSPADVVVSPGSGVIYDNGHNSNRQVVVVGDIVTNDAITVTITNGIHLVSYPFSSEIALNDSALTNAANQGDKIFARDTANQQYLRFSYFGEIPGDSLRSFKWLDSSANPTDFVLGLGTSFFYENNSTSAVVWTENRNY